MPRVSFTHGNERRTGSPGIEKGKGTQAPHGLNKSKKEKITMRGTIRHNGEIAEMFEKARRVHTDCVMALIKKTNNGRDLKSRVAFVAGKKLGAAPLRNKAKRRMREASMLSCNPLAGYDVVFVAKSPIIDAGFDVVLHDFEKIKNELNQARG